MDFFVLAIICFILSSVALEFLPLILAFPVSAIVGFAIGYLLKQYHWI